MAPSGVCSDTRTLQPGQLFIIGSAKMFDDNIIAAPQNALLLLNALVVLRPLAELAPDLVHPVTGLSMGSHWDAFDASGHPLTRVDVIL